MRIALTGNPNSGKTTMYNALTGRNERIGNWAGVTVEKKESLIKKTFYDGMEELVAVDLPGAYSMSPFTSEESITSHYVKQEHPDVIINIVDATNLSRSLFFTSTKRKKRKLISRPFPKSWAVRSLPPYPPLLATQGFRKWYRPPSAAEDRCKARLITKGIFLSTAKKPWKRRIGNGLNLSTKLFPAWKQEKC